MRRMLAKALALLMALATLFAPVVAAHAAVPATDAGGAAAAAAAEVVRKDVNCDPTVPDYAGTEACGNPGTGGGTHCSITSFDAASSHEGGNGWNDHFPRYDSDNPCLPTGKAKVSKSDVNVGEKFHDDITITPQRESPGVTGTVDYTRRDFYVRPYASALQQDGTYKALEGYAPEDIKLTDAQLKDLSDGKDVTVATPDATYGKAGKVLWGFAFYMDGGKEKTVLIEQDPSADLTDATVTVTDKASHPGIDAEKHDKESGPVEAELATRASVKGGYSDWHPEEGVASGGTYNFGSLGDSFDDNIALRGDLPEGGYVEVTAYEPQAGDRFDPAKAKPMSGFPQRIDLTARQIADAKAGKWVTFASKETGPVTAKGRIQWAATLYDAKGNKVTDDTKSKYSSEYNIVSVPYCTYRAGSAAPGGPATSLPALSETDCAPTLTTKTSRDSVGTGGRFHDVVTITLPKVPDGKGGFYDEYMGFHYDDGNDENFYTMDGRMYLYLDVTAYEPQDGKFDKGSAKVLHNEKIRLTDQQTKDLLKNHSVTIDTSDVSADRAGNVYWAVSLYTDAVTPEGGEKFLNRYKGWTSLKELPALWATHKVGIPEETTKVTPTPVPMSKDLAQTGVSVSVPGLVAVGLLIAATVLGIVAAKRSRIGS
ncbi:hypothetical protein [Bifidobacterium bifidum]|uniref:hypothetical protein n=1 Tax=Bifidobacterium bifidum TaxID=1681 RepID=UPI000658457D|nr:hypothetical protein [Bifidobacterium bifidum]KLN81685.1 hypothetical protein B0085_1741 [Bifidobacterium bifidum]